MVTREPEWDDRQRDKMLGLALYEQQVCSGCGFHQSLTDPQYAYQIEERTCPVCAASARFLRMQADADKQARKRPGGSSPTAPDPADGRHVSVRLTGRASLEGG